MTTNREHAVVLGGGIAGLLAARVLSDSYARVTIVERDTLPAGPEPRRGVPQGHHVHGLLPGGGQIIERLFPGLTDDLEAAGALVGDILANVRWYLYGQQLRKQPTGLTAVSASRALIEGTIRGRVRELDNVTVLDGQDIVGVQAGPDRRRITGVRLTSPRTETSQILPADLVVDATGRASRASRWLAELGYQPPAEDVVHIDVSYSSMRFVAPPELFGDDVVISTTRYPGKLRGSVMQRLEDGTALVTLTGILGERPPADLAGCLEYARSLAVPDTYELMRDGQAVTDPVQYRFPTYVRRRYEELTEFPAGLLVVGDAVCNFNPVYAQGMSVAAIGATALAAELSEEGDPDPARYFAAVARAVAGAWGISVGSDMSVPGVTGPILPKSPLTAEYMRSLQLAAVDNSELAAAFIRVSSLIDPPPALLHPSVVAAVERHQAALV
jgi:2-polyprenyl-6-methoxyphenol hydroxylase-like FAD-dependent oxidoreductase